MTSEETITALELAISEVEWNYPLDISIALETAIEALKKQIARKPIKETLKTTDLQDFYCPSCKKRIISKLDGECHSGRLQKYCDNCGQALWWGETND